MDRLENLIRATAARIESDKTGRGCVAASLMEVGEKVARVDLPTLTEFERKLPKELYEGGSPDISRVIDVAEIGGRHLSLEIDHIELPLRGKGIPVPERFRDRVVESSNSVGLFPDDSIVILHKDGRSHCLSTNIRGGSGRIAQLQREKDLEAVAIIKFKPSSK